MAGLRVCYLISWFHPVASGAERQALAQGMELVKRGHEVRVLTRSVPGLPENDEVGGVRIHRWLKTSVRGPLFGLSFVGGVIRGLRRLRGECDLVHTHQALWESISTGLGRDLLGGMPVLVQPASSGYFGEAQEMARTRGFRVLRALALRNRSFAAISADIEREWKALGVESGRIVRMASGVDAREFHPGLSAVERELPPRPRAIFTGRCHPQKNLGLLLDAWPEVHGRTGASLVIAGEGPERAGLQERVKADELSASVVFTGAVERPAEYLRACDAFVLPSRAEGMSNSLLEAMATGLPCVVSDIGGNRDLIEDGRTGLVLPLDDVGAWVVGLTEVLGGGARVRKLGEAARERVEREFALPVVVDRYVELYRRMLGERARGER